MILQELILTDDCLQYCNTEVFEPLFESLTTNTYSSLTLLDLSRNLHTVNDNSALHDQLIKALKNQKSKQDPDPENISNRRKLKFNSKRYLEQLWITTSSPKVQLSYIKLLKNKNKLPQVSSLRVQLNDMDLRTSTQ